MRRRYEISTVGLVTGLGDWVDSLGVHARASCSFSSLVFGGAERSHPRQSSGTGASQAAGPARSLRICNLLFSPRPPRSALPVDSSQWNSYSNIAEPSINSNKAPCAHPRGWL